MILEVEVPVLGKKYDFQIDEDAPLWDVKEEIVEMICSKEQCMPEGDIDRMLLFLPDGRMLCQELSARESSLLTGDRILMV